MNLRSAFSLALVCGALLLGACRNAPPIRVESAKAVIVQNETTKKHIKTFTDTNKRTQVHVEKIQEHAGQEQISLETAKRHLEELLKMLKQ